MVSVYKIIAYLVVSVSICLSVFVALPAMAQQQPAPSDLLGLNYGRASGLPNEVDPRTATARIINTFLELLGTIAVVLVVYAGFLWMTSAGAEDKIDKAKKILTGSVVGLLIIVSAFIITNFVARETYRAVTGDRYQPVDQPFN